MPYVISEKKRLLLSLVKYTNVTRDERYLVVFFLLLAMQAITLHMVSYAGRADMQILVAKDIIPDPGVLAKCFEDALLEMKAAAEVPSRS